MALDAAAWDRRPVGLTGGPPAAGARSSADAGAVGALSPMSSRPITATHPPTDRSRPGPISAPGPTPIAATSPCSVLRLPLVGDVRRCRAALVGAQAGDQAQQEVGIWLRNRPAAMRRLSAIVRYGAHVSARSSTVIPAVIA